MFWLLKKNLYIGFKKTYNTSVCFNAFQAYMESFVVIKPGQDCER